MRCQPDDKEDCQKTLHAGRSFEGAQLTQLNRREFVQRGSFQLNGCERIAFCYATRERHTEDASSTAILAVEPTRILPVHLFRGARGSLPAGIPTASEVRAGEPPIDGTRAGALPRVLALTLRPNRISEPTNAICPQRTSEPSSPRYFTSPLGLGPTGSCPPIRGLRYTSTFYATLNSKSEL